MNEKERKSCIFTIKTLMNLAYNIHGVMDVVDADNCKKIIEMLDSGYLAGRWIPVTETPPLWDDLMLKVHDRRCSLDGFRYYVMGFYDGEEFQTYFFRHQDDHDIEIVGWQLCPWKGEQE